MRRACLLAVVAGCALTSRSAPLHYRYFAPVATLSTASPTTLACPRLRLGRVSSSDHLRYRIAHRRSAVEVELYETLRWTERPEDYVRRALASSLFDQRGLHQAVDGVAPTLDVELTAFEEVERGAQRFGRVALRYRLVDEHDVLERQTIEIEREVGTAEITRVVEVIGDALAAATEELGRRVARQLCR